MVILRDLLCVHGGCHELFEINRATAVHIYPRNDLIYITYISDQSEPIPEYFNASLELVLSNSAIAVSINDSKYLSDLKLLLTRYQLTSYVLEDSPVQLTLGVKVLHVLQRVHVEGFRVTCKLALCEPLYPGILQRNLRGYAFLGVERKHICDQVLRILRDVVPLR